MEQTAKDYNTRRPQMIIPEYGRNIQKMVEYAMSVENREERNKVAHAIISIMGQLNPHFRDIVDFKHKLWDHLYIISDFKIDVDSPYPIPNKETIFKKPEKMHYPQEKIKFKHYGKSIEELIKVAITFDDGDEKRVLVETIANIMKKNYLTFSQNSIDDNLIVTDIKKLSNNQLQLDPTFQLTNTNEILASIKKKKTTNNSKNGKTNHKQKQNNYKRKRY